MANRQTRDVGQLGAPTATASVTTRLPDVAADTGAGFRALEALGGQLTDRLSRMADQAAANEGAQAGMSAGEKAGAIYLQRADGDAAAADRPNAAPADVTVLPGQGSAGPTALDGTPLQLRHDGTIRGDAFDAAALKAYSWRFKAGLATDIGAAADANADSPAGFEKALAGIRDSYGKDLGADPELQDIFDKTLVESAAPARLSIAAAHEQKLKADARDAADTGTDAVAAELTRNAYALGANPAADTLLAAPIQKALAAIENEVADGTFTKAEGEAKKNAVTAGVLNGRTQGTFDALPTPTAKQDFAKSVMDGWASGKGPYASLSLTQAKDLSDSLYQKATTAANQLTATQKGQAASVKGLIEDDVTSLAATGKGLDPTSSGLTPDKVQLLLGQEGYDKWQADRATATQAWQATAGMELETPAELGQRLTALQPKPGQPGFADADKIYQGAVKQAQSVLEERAKDPLGQANGAGLVSLGAIDTTTPDALMTSLSVRAKQAAEVSSTYGTPLTMFRPQERQALATALLDNPALIPAFARSAETALGNDGATATLSELSDAGPEIAHAAGLSMATGDASVADDVARTLAARKDKTFTAKMPADGELTTAAGTVLGNTFAQNDSARAAVIGTANLLFEKDANALGFDPSQVNKPGSAAAAAYARDVDRALGGQTINGVKYGGITSVNGVPTVAPSFMPADQPQQLLSSMRDSDLDFLPAIQSANAVPVRAQDLRGAHLVAVGDGQYRVALGDPQGLDPRYVAAKAGGFWTLDLQQLAALHQLPEFSKPGFNPLGFLSNTPAGADPVK